MACTCTAKVKRLELRLKRAEQEAASIRNLLEVLTQVMSNDWHAPDPVTRRRQERQQRMAQARITGVAR